MKEKAYLILQNGLVFEGERAGASGDVAAELVFATPMTGYLETLTDPSYHGQIVVETFPLIGNCGVIPADFESVGAHLAAYIVGDMSETPSNFRSEGILSDWLAEQGVVTLCGVDTRAVTRVLREYGVMNAAIVSELPFDIEAFSSELAKRELASDVYAVTSKAPYTLGEGKKHIALWDFGYKRAMAAELIKRGCRVTVMPADSSAEDILALAPDGVLLSNGPGNPAVYRDIIREVGALAASGVPIFGICLGHQLLALSRGGASSKLKYGHRGANQPVKDTKTGALYITSQNHGYAVSSLPEGARESFINLNDGSNEGIEYRDIGAFSVQFHPEARGGPRDTAFLFDEFLRRTEGL